MAIVLMICFARSGGTLLNQCLGALPNIVMLSEVNPLGGGSGATANASRTVREQAKNWYRIELKSDDCIGGILELEEICKLTNRQLIVRDWSFINFVPYQDNDYNPPKKLLTLDYLLAQNCEVRPFAFVRDVIDVWISRNMPENIFFSEYLNYVNSILDNKIRIFKYEDFCENPQSVMQEICAYLQIAYSDEFQNYKSFGKVNGDVQIISRGNQCSEIKTLPRKIISREKVAQVNCCAEMIEANRLLDYPISYYGRPRENFLKKAIGKVLSIT